jgi:hypothetical protein
MPSGIICFLRKNAEIYRHNNINNKKLNNFNLVQVKECGHMLLMAYGFISEYIP